MNILSGLDASFLYLETPEMPMHVGSFCIYQLPPDFKGTFLTAIKAHIAQRMHLAPIFSRKLRFMPLQLGHPAWLQAEDVDLDFHIRRVKGKTLTERQVEAACAELHGRLMDRRYPLWEFHVFERIKLADGSICAGLYSKIHHAALDGKGGTVLTQAIMDISSVPREVPAPSAAPAIGETRDLKMSAMIGSVFSNSLAQYAKLIKGLPHTAQVVRGALAKRALGGVGDRTPPKPLFRLAPMTVFNVAVTRERAFGTARLPFAECRSMAKAVGGSFNDIVLWICATALRTYLTEHGGIPKKSMLAAMPVSLREQGNVDLNTQASMSVVELGTQFSNPMRRMQAILASTAKVKNAMTDLKGVLPTDYPSLLAPWIVGGLAKAAYRTYSTAGLSRRLPMMANLVISNVPGPSVPLYMAGAKMLTFHPMSIVVHGVALNITIQTYAGSVDFGLVADKEAVPAMAELTDALVRAFEEGRQWLTRKKPTMAKTVAVKSVSGRAKKYLND
ncbi:MAG: wax ester/triacylglycerol synthase family O-acyltransferase [Comamonadaceae bacterium]